VLLLTLALGGLEGSAATWEVLVNSFDFNPKELTVSTGDTVNFLCRSDGRTVSGTGTEGFCGSEFLFKGDICQITFDAVGDYPYRDENRWFSAGMTGVVHVVENSSGKVSLQAPLTNTVFTPFDPVTVEVESTDEDGVNRVDFYVAGALASTLTTTNVDVDTYQVQLATNLFSLGTNSLEVVMTDELRATTTNVFELVVADPPDIQVSTPVVADEMLTLTIDVSNDALLYYVERSVDLNIWTTASTSNTGESRFTFSETLMAPVFYRVRATGSVRDAQ